MPGVTPNYNLAVYSALDTQTKFLTYRTAIAGTQETSNFYIIDTVLGNIQGSITELQNRSSITYVKAINVIGVENYYESIVENYTAYTPNEPLIININKQSTGPVTLNINSLGTREVVKYNSAGTLIPLEPGDWRALKDYLVVNLGNQWVWVGATSADQMNIQGTSGNAVSISADNTFVDSGKGFGTANGIATTDADGNLVQGLRINSVGTTNISNGAITNEKLTANSVNTTQLANGSVTTAKLAASAVTDAKLASNAVITDKITNAAVTIDKMAANSVGTSQIVNTSITSEKLAADAIFPQGDTRYVKSQNSSLDRTLRWSANYLVLASAQTSLKFTTSTTAGQTASILSANNDNSSNPLQIGASSIVLFGTGNSAVPIYNVATPTENSHAANKSYVDTKTNDMLTQTAGDARYLKLTGGYTSGTIGVTTPSNGQISLMAINGGAQIGASAGTTYVNGSGELTIAATTIKLTSSPIQPVGTSVTQIKNMAAPTEDLDAANKKYVDDTITSRVSGFMPITGGTFTGPVIIKSGTSNYGGKLNFGDGDYVHLYELSDDKLEIKSKDTTFNGPARSSVTQDMGTGQFRNIIVYASGTDINSVATPPAGTLIAILE